MLIYKKSIIYRNQENEFILIKEGKCEQFQKSILSKINNCYETIPSLYEDILDKNPYLDRVNNYQDIENILIGLVFYADISIGNSKDFETYQIDDVIIYRKYRKNNIMDKKLLFQWKDTDQVGIGYFSRQVKPVFKNILPTNSGKSFNYHLHNYCDLFLQDNKLDNLSDEIKRFEIYIKVIYNKK